MSFSKGNNLIYHPLAKVFIDSLLIGGLIYDLWYDPIPNASDVSGNRDKKI
jgi:hypothetical protein